MNALILAAAASVVVVEKMNHGDIFADSNSSGLYNDGAYNILEVHSIITYKLAIMRFDDLPREIHS